MTPDAKWLAATHAACFVDARAWSADEFTKLLQREQTILIAKTKGFALASAVLDEAELLTIAVLPSARRLGFGSTILAEMESELRHLGVARLFLEVSTENTAALSLYYRSDYSETGRRSGYYPARATTTQDALILSKSLF